MTIRVEKARLLAFGVLLMVAVDLIVVLDRTPPLRPSPCAPVTVIESPPVFHAKRAQTARFGDDFHPRIASTVSDADLAPLNLEAMVRLQQVAEAGSRDLFSYLLLRQAKPSVTPPRAAGIGPIPRAVSHPEVEALSRHDVFYYGYTRRRGSPLLAFLLMEDDIYLAKRGDVIRGRYRIVELGASSLTVEDMLSGDRQIVPMSGSPEH